MRHHHLSATIICAVLLAACGEPSTRYYHPMSPSTEAASAPNAATSHAASQAAAAPPPTDIMIAAASGTSALYAKPFVIRADLTFRTPDVRKTAAEIEQSASQLGGFIASNQTTSRITETQDFEQADGMLLRLENYISSTELVARIPRENTQKFLTSIQPHITWLEEQNFSADNISIQVHRQFLTAQREQQHAKDLQQLNQTTPAQQNHRRDTLEAHYQARAQEDESKTQQLELQDKIQYSTITLNFSQPEQIAKTVTPNPKTVAEEYSPNAWASIKQVMTTGWQQLLTICLFILQIWYIWLIIAAIWYGRRAWKNRIRRRENQNIEYVAAPDWEDDEIIDEISPPQSRRRKKFGNRQS